MGRDTSSAAKPGALEKPSKPCICCGGTILWRRRLASDWDKVRYCSASCRRVSVARARSEHSNCPETNAQLDVDVRASAA